MPKFQLNKLVRDGIINDQIAQGQTPHWHELGPEEHRRELLKKVIEELGELSTTTQDEAAKEVADVQQALDDYIALLGLTKQDVAEAQRAKAEKMGTFAGGKYIGILELQEGDKWAEYYRGEPERFPEIKD